MKLSTAERVAILLIAFVLVFFAGYYFRGTVVRGNIVVESEHAEVTVTPSPTVSRVPASPSVTPAPEPEVTTEAPQEAVSSDPVTETDADGRIDLNTATVEELQTLPRIGPKLAERIVEYRTTNGPFQAPEEIVGVTGIGEKTYENLKDLIKVEEP